MVVCRNAETGSTTGKGVVVVGEGRARGDGRRRARQSEPQRARTEHASQALARPGRRGAWKLSQPPDPPHRAVPRRGQATRATQAPGVADGPLSAAPNRGPRRAQSPRWWGGTAEALRSRPSSRQLRQRRGASAAPVPRPPSPVRAHAADRRGAGGRRVR